jgi:metal-responsive CopG/Arc/MetJ family transcriptional regulator
MPSFKTVITIERDLLGKVTRYCRSTGVSRSRFFRDAARQYLARSNRNALIKRINEANEGRLSTSEARQSKALMEVLRTVLKDEPW